MSNILDAHVGAYEGNNIYDFDNSILLNWYPKRILELTPSTASLLELGLGHGYSTPLFSRAFARHVVLEGSPAVIANFRKTAPECGAEIIETYFETFEGKERFDVIVMGFILEHVDNPAEILARYRQFLVPNGTLFVAVPNMESMNRRLGHLAGLLPDLQRLMNIFVLNRPTPAANLDDPIPKYWMRKTRIVLPRGGGSVAASARWSIPECGAGAAIMPRPPGLPRR